MNPTPVPPAPAPVATADFGPFAGLTDRAGLPLPGKAFLSAGLGLTGSEISLNRLPAGHGYPFRHRHRRNEEVYVVVGGRGLFLAGDREIPLQEGTVVRLAPEVERTLTAAADAPLDFICFQAPPGDAGSAFGADGIVTSLTVPFPRTLPLPERIRQHFAQSPR